MRIKVCKEKLKYLGLGTYIILSFMYKHNA